MAEDSGIIELYKPGRERPNVFKVAAEKSVPISREAQEEKTVIELNLGEKHKASLYKRTLKDAPSLLGFSTDEVPKSLSDKYIKAWQLLNKRGMHVVETVRKIDDITIATTNLEEYGTVYDIKIDSRKTRKPQIGDEEFLLIPMAAIKQELMRQVEIANENGIFLPHDGLFHIFVSDSDIDQNFSWKIILLDLTDVGIYAKPSDMIETNRETNRMMASGWLKKLEIVRENIQNGMEEQGIPSKLVDYF